MTATEPTEFPTLADLPDADLLASVTDDHIEQLLATREAGRRRLRELAEQFAEAEADLDATNTAISNWLADLRVELRVELRGGAL